MTFGATVVDHKSELIRDLAPGDFEVLEDGKSQTLRFYAAGDGAAAPVLHLGFLLDASGSMVSDMKLAQSAAIKVLNLLPEYQDITLVDFDTQVRFTRYPQRDFPRLVEGTRQRKPDGWTALDDTLGTYLDGVDQDEGRCTLVMYLDDADSRSVLKLDETLTLLKASPVTVYAIGLVEHWLVPATFADDDDATGGSDRRPGVLPVEHEGVRERLRMGAGPNLKAVLPRLSVRQYGH